MIQIQIIIQDKNDEILCDVNRLRREDATDTESNFADMIEQTYINLLEYLNQNGILSIKYINQIKEQENE